MENFSYAFVQSLHNLGAVGVVAVPVVVLYLLRNKIVCNMSLYILVALASAGLQLLSGLGFAITSNHFLGQIPEIEGVAHTALVIKVSSVVLSIMIYVYMLATKKMDVQSSRSLWRLLSILGLLPLIGASFLRWYG